VRTELKNLDDAGIVLSEKSGNQLLYRINPECPLYPEIRMMIVKTFSLTDEIRKRLKSIKTIKFAYIFGSFASGDFDSKSDVDLMIVGNVDPQKIMSKLMDYERVIDREINTKVYSLSEYNAQLKIKNSFINQVHNGSRIDVIGGNDES
jgi:predicted nucleotidyltransferase